MAREAESPGRNKAKAWVVAQGFGVFWKTLNPKARAALCDALSCPTIPAAEKAVRDAQRELDAANAALAAARTRDDVLAATLKELRALYDLVHGVGRDRRRTSIEDDPTPEKQSR